MFKKNDRVTNARFGSGIVESVDADTYSIVMVVVKLDSGETIYRAAGEWKLEISPSVYIGSFVRPDGYNGHTVRVWLVYDPLSLQTIEVYNGGFHFSALPLRDTPGEVGEVLKSHSYWKRCYMEVPA